MRGKAQCRTLKTETMKRHSEKMTEAAVQALTEVLAQYVGDTGAVLDRFEASHDDAECCGSRAYAALVAGHFALKEALERINNTIKQRER